MRPDGLEVGIGFLGKLRWLLFSTPGETSELRLPRSCDHLRLKRGLGDWFSSLLSLGTFCVTTRRLCFFTGYNGVLIEFFEIERAVIGCDTYILLT
jgi:hypothetical protein